MPSCEPRLGLLPDFQSGAIDPASVAQLFPDVINAEVAVLCGEFGLRAAMRELGSGNPSTRCSAASVLKDLVALGFDVPVEPLQAALAEEDDRDCEEAILGAIRAVQTRVR
ncbi:MAG: hypothetical protein AB7O97_01115 [Planctomycetota bacterium]